MTRIALTQEKIIHATIELAQKNGLNTVSFPRLAEHFGIKAPSLYNHFRNMEEVRIATAVYLEEILNHKLTQAMIGRTPTDALRAYAESYKEFSEEYAAVYELVNLIHQTNNTELTTLAKENIHLIRRSLENFDLQHDEILHQSRVFRSSLHGFVTLSQLGYFQNSEEISKESSFHYMVEQFLTRLPQKKI